MEFKFEYKDGELKLYQNVDEEKVTSDDLGNRTSPQFRYVAKRIKATFWDAMKIVSKESGHANVAGVLELKLSTEKDSK